MEAVPMFASTIETQTAETLVPCETAAQPITRESYAAAHEADAAIKNRIAWQRERTERNALKQKLFAVDPKCSHCGRRLFMETGRENSAMLAGNRLTCRAHVQAVSSRKAIKEGGLHRSQEDQLGFADLTRFEYSHLDEVTESRWDEMSYRLQGHARRVLSKNSLDPDGAVFVTDKVIESVVDGKSGWNPSVEPNLLKFMFDRVREIAEREGHPLKSLDGAPVDATQSRPKKRRSRRRGIGISGVLSQIQDGMDVKDVVQHLPMIALLVGRLNELLNPIAKTTGGES